MLLPEGLTSSPYEVLDYDSTLTLHDRKGNRANIRRRQAVRFLQDGVSAILDHCRGYHSRPRTCEGPPRCSSD